MTNMLFLEDESTYEGNNTQHNVVLTSQKEQTHSSFNTYRCGNKIERNFFRRNIFTDLANVDEVIARK